MEALDTRMQNILPRAFRVTPARIIVALLLGLLALPVIYVGILGIFFLIRADDAFSPNLVVAILTPVLAVLVAFGTLLSFRSALVTAGALAVFYLRWAFSLYPFTGVLPLTSLQWIDGAVFAMLCLNLAWITWSLRAARRR